MKYRFLAFVAAFLLAVSAGLTPAQPVQAATPSGCVTPYVCLYAGANYTGFSIFYNVTAAANQGCKTLPSGINNTIESIYGNYLNSGKILVYYNSHNCTGSALFNSTGGAYPTISASHRNVVSSINFLNLP